MIFGGLITILSLILFGQPAIAASTEDPYPLARKRIYSLGLSSEAYAGFEQVKLLKTETVQKWTYYFLDFNDDHQVDLVSIFETHQGKPRLIEERYPKTRTVVYRYGREPFQIQKLDTDHDGKFDEIKSLYHENNSIRIVTEAGSDKTTKILPLRESKNDNSDICKPRYKEITDLIGALSKSTSPTPKKNGSFTDTGFGFTYHESCGKNFGDEFMQNNIKGSMKTGLECMQKINKEFRDSEKEKKTTKRETTGVETNNQKILTLLNDTKKPVQIVCNDSKTEYYGDATAANASSDLDDKVKLTTGEDIAYPYVSFNPSSKSKEKDSRYGTDASSFQGTLFHEMLHTLGYKHQEGTEFSYGCGACCFPEFGQSADMSLKNAACRVCLGNYDNTKDKKFIQDHAILAATAGGADFNYPNANRYLLSKDKVSSPDDKWLLALAYGDPGSPLGPALSRKMFGKMPGTSGFGTTANEIIKKNEEDFAIDMRTGKPEEENSKTLQTYANSLAGDYVNFHVDRNTSRVISTDTVCERIKSLKSTDENLFVLNEMQQKSLKQDTLRLYGQIKDYYSDLAAKEKNPTLKKEYERLAQNGEDARTAVSAEIFGNNYSEETRKANPYLNSEACQ